MQTFTNPVLPRLRRSGRYLLRGDLLSVRDQHGYQGSFRAWLQGLFLPGPGPLDLPRNGPEGGGFLGKGKLLGARPSFYHNGLFYLSYSVEEHLCIAHQPLSSRPLCPGEKGAAPSGHQGDRQPLSSRTPTGNGIFTSCAFSIPTRSGARK